MENFIIPESELNNPTLDTLEKQFQFLDEYALDEPEHAKIIALEKLYIQHLIETHNENIPFGDEKHILFKDPSELIWVHSEEFIDRKDSPNLEEALGSFSEDPNNIFHRLYTKKIQPDAQLNIPYIYNDYYYISINDKPAIYINGEDRGSSSVFAYSILIISK